MAMVFILLGFDEATAYAGFCFLLENICIDYHKPGLPGYLRDIAVLDTLTHLHLPQVHLQLEAAGVPLLSLWGGEDSLVCGVSCINPSIGSQ